METTSWILTIIILSTLHGFSTWKLYTKAEKSMGSFCTVYNGFKLMELINRPKWWIILIFIPIINLLLFPIIWIETLRTFGKKSTKKTCGLSVLTLGIYITYVNYTQEVSYEANRSTKPATKALDTLGSLSFAIIVATFVHSYFIQPFVIPTSSLKNIISW